MSRYLPCPILVVFLFCSSGLAQPEFVKPRNEAYAEQLESYFRQWLVDHYPERAEEHWDRSYSSIEAFLASVEPNRKRYRQIFAPPVLKPTGALERSPHSAASGAEWLSLQLGPLSAQALLVIPGDSEEPMPLVIAQHGIGSYPERVFGIGDETNQYHDYGKALTEAGFAVLAPMNLRTVHLRNRIERLARLADTTLPGIEFSRIQALLDQVLEDPRIDKTRVGMWGISLGGMATMFWMPMEPRISCGIVTAWFNHRRNKMVIPDERYSCFLETEEEHAFFRGWLTEFTDSDVVSLICPRPLQIQHGKKDGIAWWPQVITEFNDSKIHYEQLGLEDRFELVIHEGRHEIELDSGMRFLTKWLGKR